MTARRSQQALKVFGASVLVLCAFEACSSDDRATPNPFDGPPTLAIAGISLGTGSIGQGGETSLLACDNTIGVTLAISNWLPDPPGKCGPTPQCGQIRVSLLDGPNGTELASTTAAAVGANLDITELVANGPVKSGHYAIQAELVDDEGHVYPLTDGGNNTAQQEFDLTLNSGCANGAAGASSGGAAGQGTADQGAAGKGGMGGAPSLGSGGAGDDVSGSGGVPAP